MNDRTYDCYCDDNEYQQSNGKMTHSEVYQHCQFCWDKIEAEDCVPQFFIGKSKYDVVTLEELEERIQKLTNTASMHKEFIKLLQAEVKALQNNKGVTV